MSYVMAGRIWSRSVRDPRPDHRCRNDKVRSHDIRCDRRPFRRALVHRKHQGVSDPIVGRDRRSKTDTGVAHALVSVNHDPQRAPWGGTERRPFRTEAGTGKSLHVKRVVAPYATADTAVGSMNRDIDEGLRTRVKNRVQAVVGFVPLCILSRNLSEL
jgi:hypothetical protein